MEGTSVREYSMPDSVVKGGEEKMPVELKHRGYEIAESWLPRCLGPQGYSKARGVETLRLLTNHFYEII